MTDTLLKEVHYSLGGIINDIGLDRIPDPADVMGEDYPSETFRFHKKAT